MSRFFTVPFEGVAISVAQDLWQIEALTTNIIIHGFVLGQITDLGDAAAEALEVKIRRVTDTLANVTAEVKLDLGSAALTADININDTTQLVTGVETIHADVWYIQMPYIWFPPPELRPVIAIDDLIVVTISAPTDPITASGTIYLEQFGS